MYKMGIVEAFSSSLSDQGGWQPRIPELPFEVLDSSDASKPKEQFIEEVSATVAGLNGDKAPSLFQLGFCEGGCYGIFQGFF